ncbi:thiol-disulfide oxidoreductase DCC family protein [Bacillus sp. FJAT-50079]|uniref:thiol-disulfide oxidoreductase DCC family protein n=1 Tax=Bacillus sp. FJAT-50079 TaxID=2833577 RepID=UPI001BC929FD|nr:thiol-disulfide oxidoreductase DCC family protein [Bacillus sp. FJAT-50079]MBS4210740.1 thiol-disulfide oxidoreductase DCC family protein [Bacillus sp. FJAT-50079]
MLPIILFDGDCHFCNSNVQFIIKHDRVGYFHFASLQSEIGQSLLETYSIPSHVDSLVVINNKKAYVKSTAALQICRHLDGAWKCFFLFTIIPAPIRNLFYDIVAKNRYRLVRKKESCIIPSPEVRKRFLS